MPTPRRTSITTVFTNPDGTPLANGYITVRLLKDAVSADGSQVGAGASATANLNSAGIPIEAVVWPSIWLSPDGTYLIDAFESSGQRVAQLELLIPPGPAGFGDAFGASFAS
jgi:hypothetical protein